MKKLLTSLFALCFAASIYAAEYPTITIGDLKSAMTSQKIVMLDANGRGCKTLSVICLSSLRLHPFGGLCTKTRSFK
jgi:hypothetical protein